MPAGRPEQYTKDLCEKVIPLLKKGASIEEIGLELGIGYSTIYEYMERHPEFAEAIKKGREFSKGWWMKEGRTNLKDKDFSSTLWYMNMKNRFGWTDRQENNITATVKQEDILEELEEDNE
jgi:Helix-turn-helix domain of resolvase